MSLVKSIRPSTPQMVATSSASTEQPYTPNGSWKHPKFDEIARRQYATTFDERNVRDIVVNSSLLLLSIFANSITSKVKLLDYVALPINLLVKSVPFSMYMIIFIRFVFLYNIAKAFVPLVRRYYPDDIADIPLTPSQRASMGLKADNAQHTPGSAFASPNYVTPPRYSRSTPRSASFNQGEFTSQSPLSDSPRASLARSNSGSPFAGNNVASPLFQKTLGSGSATKRLSYGGSPMSSSFFGESSSSALPSTPTPSTGKATVGLNNKWLYERRRDSPRSTLFFG